MLSFRRFFRRALVWAAIFLILYISIIFLIRGSTNDFHIKRFQPPTFNYYKCPAQNFLKQNVQLSSPIYSKKVTLNKRILLIADSKSKYQKSIFSLLEYLKIPIRVEFIKLHDQFLVLNIKNKGLFNLIVFEDYRFFNNLSDANKFELLNYCSEFGIGMISFLFYNVNKSGTLFSHFTASGNQIVKNLRFIANSGVNFIAKTSIGFLVDSFTNDWTLFSNVTGQSILIASDANNNNLSTTILVYDNLNIPHIIFGQSLDHWIIKVAFLDALIYLNVADFDLERYIQIDIDDIFVGQTGTKLIKEDVISLIETQKDLRNYIENFSFLLGFSGYFFRNGDSLDISGDEALVALANNFLWFPHMWRHNQAHEFHEKDLQDFMTQNKLFSQNMKLNLILGYAVSPHHSSVYPVYNSLYNSWRTIWNVTVTSTEEYPHIYPAAGRRAFIYNNICVLSRQTCGLFTHTFFFFSYPDGVQKLYKNIFGGELFTTILMNKFSIFMTHQQNYSHDRLGSFTFLNLVRFIYCWTNIKLKFVPPVELAKKYFQKFPNEKKLIYTNFCSDNRHKKILPINVTCNNYTLPNLIILGPQKTGTSALSLFLLLHPNVSTNKPINYYFEELHFFNGANYAKGLDWYAEKFSHITSNAETINNNIIFEKTANYFDSFDAPRKIKALLPKTKLIIILSNPVNRAYSWYQHMILHNDPIALRYSAEEVLMGNDSITLSLRNRCLMPGIYVNHLQRWLDYFLPSQLIFVDGNELQYNPRLVLLTLYKKLNLSTDMVDLSKSLKYNDEKGFYCAVNTKTLKLKCLGQNKGRKYSRMSNKLKKFLNDFYAPYNNVLNRTFNYYKFPMPYFLKTFK